MEVKIKIRKYEKKRVVIFLLELGHFDSENKKKV